MSLLGFPVIYDKDLPKGTVYFMNTATMFVVGTWVSLPSVNSIIASQRRRRRK